MSVGARQMHDVIMGVVRHNLSFEVAQTVFEQVIVSNDTTSMQMFLDCCADAIVPMSGGRKITDHLLSEACHQGTLEMIEHILPFADPSADGNLAMERAVRRGDEAVVELLLHHGAPLTSDHPCDSPLWYCVRNTQPHLAQILIDRGADINEHNGSIMLSAVHSGHNELMLLFEQGDWASCIEAHMGIDNVETDAQRRKEKEANLIRALGACPLVEAHTQRDEQTINTPDHQSNEYCRLLLSMIARNDDWKWNDIVKKCSPHQMNLALIWAAQLGRDVMVSHLISYADPKYDDSQALRKAVLGNHLKCVQMLLPHSDATVRNSLCLVNALRAGKRRMINVLWPHSDLTACAEQLQRVSAIMSNATLSITGKSINDRKKRDEQTLELFEVIKSEKERNAMMAATRQIEGKLRKTSKL